MKNTKKGFTLVELLVVIAILAILASVAVVGYTAFINKAEESKLNSEIHQIKTMINADIMANGEYVFAYKAPTAAVGTEGEAGYVAAADGYKVYATKSGDDVVVKSVVLTLENGAEKEGAARDFEIEGDAKEDLGSFVTSLTVETGVLLYKETPVFGE